MAIDEKFRLESVLTALSRALDLASSGLSSHHEMVAIAAHRLGRSVGMSGRDLEDLCCAALLHDIGSSTNIDCLRTERLDGEESAEIHAHAVIGARRLRSSALLSPYFQLVEQHHARWDGRHGLGLQGTEIPLGSRVIHLADRFCSILSRSRGTQNAVQNALRSLASGTNTAYDPRLVEALRDIASSEAFVLDLTSGYGASMIAQLPLPSASLVTVDALIDIAQVFAEVIDAKSAFTNRHSARVAFIASALASEFGFSSVETRHFAIAGLLHDIGKLVVPSEVLESPRGLSPDEVAMMRTHPYYTLHILGSIDGFEVLARWAAYHHERLDGRGYPFRLSEPDLPLGARIISVADIVAALSEDRPYRSAMHEREVRAELLARVSDGALDGSVVRMALNMLPELRGVWPGRRAS